jgi:hypothetical protein
MQKRVLPFAFAFRAASSTGSSSTRREAFVGVEYRDDCEQYEPVPYSLHVQKIRESVPTILRAPSSYCERNRLAIGVQVASGVETHS